MTRKTFLRSALLAPALPSLSQTVLAAAHEQAFAQTLRVENRNHRLEFDRRTGEALSFCALQAPDQEFVPQLGNLPVFAVQYLDEKNAFLELTSKDAADVSVKKPAEGVIEMSFRRLGNRDFDVDVQVRMGAGEPASRWSIAIHNKANLMVTDVQFPFIAVRYELGGTKGSEALISPFWLGRLQRAPKPEDLEADTAHAWQFRPENQDSWHYPGLTMAQFLAFYNDRSGILIRCNDTSGSVKLIKAVHRAPGIRLGFSHVGDWPRSGTRRLEYEILMEAFQGDWYSAAEIYRDWSLQQAWARTPLLHRQDVPAWLIDSPPHIMIRLQGELDDGPSFLNHQFIPYPKLSSLLEPISRKLDSSLVAVLMAWERGGPWVYPDCFPPAGGEASMSEFAEEARQRGWHVGSYCNGTRWVTQQLRSGYNGENFFRKHQGEASVCRTAEGTLWRELWDLEWRTSFACCLGVSKTHALAVHFVERLVDYGLDWIQFLDQNVGCSTFPCYSPAHGHPRLPGKWMTGAMQKLLEEFRGIAHRASQQSGGRREIVFSVESTPNEFFLPFFPICDVRVSPPGHNGMLKSYVPLYHFLHHEFLLFQGGFGFGPEPYHLPIQTAYNFVLGEICGGVLTGDGKLLNRDSINWAPWNPPVGSDEDALEIMRCATVSRRTAGKPYVVYGRMLRPARKFEVQTSRWTYEGSEKAIPAVFHAVWRSPSGGLGVALANWTNQPQEVLLEDERVPPVRSASITSRSFAKVTWLGREALVLPPLSCAIAEPS